MSTKIRRVSATRVGILLSGIVFIAAVGCVCFERSLRKTWSQVNDIERFTESLLPARSQDHGDVRWYCNGVNQSDKYPQITEEEYKVYSDFLEAYRVSPTEKLYLVGTVKRNCGDKEEFRLEDKFPGSPGFEKIVSGKEMEDIEGQIRNIDIGSSSPNALLSFSRVGFNDDRTKAIVEIDFWCGPLCGEAGHRVLKRDNGRWVLTTDGVLNAKGVIGYTAYY